MIIIITDNNETVEINNVLRFAVDVDSVNKMVATTVLIIGSKRENDVVEMNEIGYEAVVLSVIIGLDAKQLAHRQTFAVHSSLFARQMVYDH